MATLGPIYVAPAVPVLSDFTLNAATAAASQVGTGIQLTGGNGAFTNSLDLSPAGQPRKTDLDSWTITMQVKAGTVTGTSYGCGPRLRSSCSVAGQLYDVVVNLDQSTGVSAGKLTMFGGTMPSLATLVTSSAALTFAAGDTLEIQLVRQLDLFTATAWNVTTPQAPVSCSYRYSTTYPVTNLLPNIGSFSITMSGGTQTLIAYRVDSTTVTNAPVAVVSDSKALFYAGGLQNAWPALLGEQLAVNSLSGGSEQTADVIARLPEIISLKPSTVILHIGRNDVANGVASATYTANLSTIVNTLVSAGIGVIALTNFVENVGINYTTLNNFINALPNAAPFTVNFAQFAFAYFLAADNVHPTPAGHQQAASQLLYSGLLPTVRIYQNASQRVANAFPT